jgi:hypothetical protein
MGQCIGKGLYKVRARALAARFGYEPAPDLPESMAKLADTVDLLLQKENNMEERILEQKGVVRKYLQERDRRRAGAALKRLKLIELSLEKTTSMRVGVEAHRDNIGEANVNMDVANALSGSAKAMRATFGPGKADNLASVEKMVDDMAESMQDCSEISQLLNEPLQAGLDSLDDFDVEAELKAFEAEPVQSTVVNPTVRAEPTLPSVPTTRPTVPENTSKTDNSQAI